MAPVSTSHFNKSKIFALPFFATCRPVKSRCVSEADLPGSPLPISSRRGLRRIACLIRICPLALCTHAFCREIAFEKARRDRPPSIEIGTSKNQARNSESGLPEAVPWAARCSNYTRWRMNFNNEERKAHGFLGIDLFFPLG